MALQLDASLISANDSAPRRKPAPWKKQPPNPADRWVPKGGDVYEYLIDGDSEWQGPVTWHGGDYAFEIARGTKYRPATKPDPYAPFREAMARGETVQFTPPAPYNDQGWIDVPANVTPNFHHPVENYRIKPKPVFVPKGGWEFRLVDPGPSSSEPAPDPYQKFRDALARGEAVQHLRDGVWRDYDIGLTPSFVMPPERYRVKPKPIALGVIPCNAAGAPIGEPPLGWPLIESILKRTEESPNQKPPTENTSTMSASNVTQLPPGASIDSAQCGQLIALPRIGSVWMVVLPGSVDPAKVKVIAAAPTGIFVRGKYRNGNFTPQQWQQRQDSADAIEIPSPRELRRQAKAEKGYTEHTTGVRFSWERPSLPKRLTKWAVSRTFYYTLGGLTGGMALAGIAKGINLITSLWVQYLAR